MGDYTSPSGAVVVGQGALSPFQSPPTMSNFGSASTASAGARAEQSQPVSVAGLPAPSPPPSGLPPARTGGTLVAPRDNPHTEGRRVLARHHVNDAQSH